MTLRCTELRYPPLFPLSGSSPRLLPTTHNLKIFLRLGTASLLFPIDCRADSVLHISNGEVRLAAGHVDIQVNVLKYSKYYMVLSIALRLPLYSSPHVLRTLLSRLQARYVNPADWLFPVEFSIRGPLDS